MATTSQQVQQLYVAYLGRAADKAGLDYWLSELNTDTPVLTLDDLRANFVNDQPEYAAIYGGLDRTAQVTEIYQNLFNRAPDAAGLTYWTTGGGSTVSADLLLTAFINGAASADSIAVSNKVFVAQTYTDTAGASYNAEAGASVIADVDGTAASVSTALTAIANGTLTGQVPGLALINAVDVAVADRVAYETANKTTTDALVAKLAANATTGTATDGITSTSTFAQKVAAIQTDADNFRLAVSSESDTSVLVTRAATADTTLKATVASLTNAEKTAANTLVAAIAAEATAKTGAATAVEKAAVEAGLTADTTATTALAAYTDAADLYSTYVLATAAERTAIDTDFADSTYFATFKAAVVKDAAYADAIKATLAATDALDTNTTTATTTTQVNGITVTGAADATAGSTNANKYVTDLAAKTAADKLVADAQAADANVTAADALTAAYGDKTAAVTDAKADLTAFTGAGIDLAPLTVDATTGAITGLTASAAKDVFYFDTNATTGVKAALIDASTGSIALGDGDSLVLGTALSYNSGALSTGNNNVSEFFLVQNGNDVQLVVETSVFGSSAAVTTAATGAVTTPGATGDNVAVITLTGVTVADLTVANGVISHVA
jgi:hypothetical protein